MPNWSYDTDELSTNTTYQVRFLIGDTVQDDPLIDDDQEIEFALSQCGSNIYRAAAFCCRRGAARITRDLALKSPVAELDTRWQAENLLKLAKEFDSEASRAGGVGVFAGGISQADKQARIDDTDRVVPSFSRETLTTVDPVTDWTI